MPEVVHAFPASYASDLAEAKRVLLNESKALEILSENLNDKFVHALDLLQSAQGRVIVTGMGKSGHVARKIAATLASTGTPAMFVHPGEANHGDLGMIEQRDAIIALSNSGETTELEGILKYAKRYKIPVIGMTSKHDSTLAKASDAALILPKVSEACPIGVAPMTSTTMMIALGDALAAALLCRKKFSTTDFSILHPGGTLGVKLQKISDLMHIGDKMPLVYESTTMSEALLIMTQKSFGCVAVCNSNNEVIGIITDGDLRRHMGSNLLQSDVTSIMTPAPLSIHPDALIAQAVQVMNDKKITSLFVSNTQTTAPFTPLGIIHIHDCLRAGQ